MLLMELDCCRLPNSTHALPFDYPIPLHISMPPWRILFFGEYVDVETLDVQTVQPGYIKYQLLSSTLTAISRINLNISICCIEIKLDGKNLKYSR